MITFNTSNLLKDYSIKVANKCYYFVNFITLVWPKVIKKCFFVLQVFTEYDWCLIQLRSILFDNIELSIFMTLSWEISHNFSLHTGGLDIQND